MGKRCRRDGTHFRNWDQSWYSSITGSQKPLLDADGNNIRGRHYEALAKSAFCRLAAAASHPSPYRTIMPTVDDVNLAYLRPAVLQLEACGGIAERRTPGRRRLAWCEWRV